MDDFIHHFLVPASWLAFWMLMPWGLWRGSHRRARRRGLAPMACTAAAPAPMPAPSGAGEAELKALRERVRTLERIVVDAEAGEQRRVAALADDIERLR